MKNVLLVTGAAVAGYGIYLFMKKKKDDCSNDKPAGPAIVKKNKEPLYSAAAIQSYDYDWNKLFPTPARLGIKNNIELNEEFGQNLASD